MRHCDATSKRWKRLALVGGLMIASMAGWSPLRAQNSPATGKKNAVVIGRWALQREKDNPHGRFTLLFRKFKEGWRVVHDHTSSA